MKVPASTYRLQLNAEFPFSKVKSLIPYFKRLGVGDLYFSPVFQARAKSPHGYDVTNPAQFNREVGDEEEFAELSRALRDEGIGIVLDIVPNHMAASEENPWWRDMLKHGPASHGARVFDVDWSAPGCDARIVLPVLGKDLEDAIADGELRIVRKDGEPVISYYARTFPLDPATYDLVPDDPQTATPADLKKLLDKQAYRLEFWRSGMGCINYRRFFDITDLAGVRIEDPAVFAATHALVIELVKSEQIDGVRVDHVDGLRDPHRYLQQLRAAIGDTYLIVEKILAPDEALREHWPIEGTTGYEFTGLMSGFYCEPDGLNAITDAYGRRTGLTLFPDIVRDKKRVVARTLFAGELNSLTSELERLAHVCGIEGDSEAWRTAIVEATACLAVYRTYIFDHIDEYDRRVLKEAISLARHHEEQLSEPVLDFLRRVLLGEELPPGAIRREQFVSNWQQFTGPVMAKGLEDTAFYTYYRLIALNEVGAHPNGAIASVEELNERFRARLRDWPYTMSSSSTHDSKRSEDVRARIQVLSELPDVWDRHLDKWLECNARHRVTVNEQVIPDVNTEIMLYQTLLGVWSDDATLSKRLRSFAQKAAREAKQYSSWLDPNESYEHGLFAFLESLLADKGFIDDLRNLHYDVAWYGALNSLSALTVKLCSPGIPDIYQGNESWAFNLVDPDNRRPVDFETLSQRLEQLATEITRDRAAELLENWADGRIKMHVTRTGLHLRRDKFQLFAHGEYVPVQVRGKRNRNVFAFARRHAAEWVVCVAGRFYSQIGRAPVGHAWAGTKLELPADAPSAWSNVLTGEVTDGRTLETIFATLPFAILVGTTS